MSVFQLVAIIFAVFMVYVVHLHQNRRLLSLVEATLWYAMWFGFVLLALFPESLLGIVQILHFTRAFDLITVIAFMILAILVVTNYFSSKEARKKLEELVRQIAIKKRK